MKDIGIIGCGVMGSAIVRAIAPTLKGKIYLYDIVSEVASNLAQETGGQILPLEALLKESTTIVLAVKPQVLGELYSLLYQAKGKQWISLAAGVSLETLVENLGSEEVIRIMPNIAASVGKSVTAIAPSKGASPLFVEETIALA
ncbi:MAG: NAD(P)-binding domain-containing protein, partial [Sphaerochaetaceae bacterium]